MTYRLGIIYKTGDISLQEVWESGRVLLYYPIGAYTLVTLETKDFQKAKKLESRCAFFEYTFFRG